MQVIERDKGKRWEAWDGGRVVLALVREVVAGRVAFSFTSSGFDVSVFDADQARAAALLLAEALGE